MRSDPLQTRPEQAGGGLQGCVKLIERGKVGLEHRVLLHGFVKKTQKIPNEDLALARRRMKEIEQ